MKIKPIIVGEDKEYYDNIRFNNNIVGIHKKITHGTNSQGKRDYAASVIFALMSINGYVVEAIQNCKNDDPLKIINAIIDIAKNKIENISLTNNSVNYQTNDVITFKSNKFTKLEG